MKKFVVLTVAAAMGLGLVACGGGIKGDAKKMGDKMCECASKKDDEQKKCQEEAKKMGDDLKSKYGDMEKMKKEDQLAALDGMIEAMEGCDNAEVKEEAGMLKKMREVVEKAEDKKEEKAEEKKEEAPAETTEEPAEEEKK